jgi:hypothetical protein
MATYAFLQESALELTSARRHIRIAGYVTFAFAAFQLVALPMVIHRDTGGFWVVEWISIASVAVSFVVAVALVRGSALAAALVAADGAYRVALFVLAIVRVLDGTGLSNRWGRASLVGAAISLLFAIFWVRAGLAALTLYRARSSPRVDAL